MGGLLALRVVRTAPAGFFKGLVLSAPALKADPKVDNALNRFMAGLLSSTFPKLEVAPLPKTHLCSDADVVSQYSRDPLVFHGMLRARVGAEFIKTQPLALASAPQLTLPLLIVHGENDGLVPISGSRELFAGAAAGDKELKTFPGLMHELHNEKGSLAAGGSVAHITAWLLQRL
jgi:acylglycerol lipase